LPDPTRVDAADLPDACWEAPARGSVLCRRSVSVPPPACGSGTDKIIRKAANPGKGKIRIDRPPHPFPPRRTLYISRGAVHGVPVSRTSFRWVTPVAANSLDDIRDSFPREAGETE
jgi:hypothetical protein